LEETKRRKLATKAKKMVELMMVSGIPTSSGFEERIRFSELEIVDANAIDTGVLSTLPEGNYLNGWDVNVAGVRIITVKRKLRHHKHAVSFVLRSMGVGCYPANYQREKEFLLRVRRKNAPEHYVGRRYGDFARLHKRLRTELPGKVLPPLPQKNKSHSTAPSIIGSHSGNNSDASSVSSVSTQMPNSPTPNGSGHHSDSVQRLLSVKGRYLRPECFRGQLLTSVYRLDHRSGDRLSPRNSVDGRPSSPALLSPKPQEVLFHGTYAEL
jgi:hypothetical protein